MSRSAWSAWSLLPLSSTLGGPKAPASWPHSIRFARFASRAAQPVRTPIESTVAFRPAVGAWYPLTTLGIPPDADISQRGKVGKAATECREAHGLRGACSRFGARWVARKLQQAGRTPCASRGSPAERHSQSELLLKAQWLFALPLAPGILLKPLGFLLTRIFRSAAKSAKPQPNVAKRMECVELAPAFEHAGWTESSSKLAALHTLREVRQPSGTASPNSY